MKSAYQLLATVAFVMTVGAISNLSNGEDASRAKQLIDQSGNLKMPKDYRDAYQFLGSWAISADEGAGGSKQIHNVYASPGTIEAFRKTGHFPDGTVLVKEVFATKNDEMTTGTVSHADALQGWFLMIKESLNAHPDNKLWGDGWVWSWFDADMPNKTTSTDYKTDCKTCHVPAQATDWIYSSGYPSLKN